MHCQAGERIGDQIFLFIYIFWFTISDWAVRKQLMSALSLFCPPPPPHLCSVGRSKRKRNVTFLGVTVRKAVHIICQHIP